MREWLKCLSGDFFIAADKLIFFHSISFRVLSVSEVTREENEIWMSVNYMWLWLWLPQYFFSQQCDFEWPGRCFWLCFRFGSIKSIWLELCSKEMYILFSVYLYAYGFCCLLPPLRLSTLIENRHLGQCYNAFVRILCCLFEIIEKACQHSR